MNQDIDWVYDQRMDDLATNELEGEQWETE